MRWVEFALGLCVCLALAGCASDGTRRAPVNEETKEAASLQVKLGRGYMDQGDLETALERLQRALQLDPRNVDAYTLMGVLHERIRRPAKAETYYRQALRLAPDNGEVNNNFGAFLCGTGRYQEADAYFIKALDDPFYRSSSGALANAGVCALKAGDANKAEDYFRRVLDYQPNHVTALFELARLSYLKHDDMRARAFLQRLETGAQIDPVMLDLGQRIETRIGDTSAANRYAKRLKNDFPDYQPDGSLDRLGPQ